MTIDFREIVETDILKIVTIDFREIVEIDFKEIVDIDFKEIVEIHFKEIVEMDLKEIVEIGISEIVNCLQRVDSNTSYINQLEIFSLLKYWSIRKYSYYQILFCNFSHNKQEVSNLLAKLAVTTCARLAGYLSGELASPDNYNVKRSLCSLLTPYIANKLKENNPPEVIIISKISEIYCQKVDIQ